VVALLAAAQCQNLHYLLRRCESAIEAFGSMQKRKKKRHGGFLRNQILYISVGRKTRAIRFATIEE